MAILLRCHFVNRCSELAPRKLHKSESIIIEIIIIMITAVSAVVGVAAAAKNKFEQRESSIAKMPE